MPTCPFSAARLHELVWTETFTVRQLAILAQAYTEEPIDEAEVRAWMQAHGVAERVPLPPKAAPPSRSLRVRVTRARRPGEGTFTRPCGYCGALVTRPLWRLPPVGEEVFCDTEHRNAKRRQDAAAKRMLRKSTAPDPEQQKHCPRCPEGLLKPLTAFNRDSSRPDGRSRLCREHENEKARRRYERTAGRLDIQ